MKVLLTSGFPETRLAEPGRSLMTNPLLSKPYTKEQLARAVREALDDAEQGARASEALAG
jgi:hypothetical protein